MKTKYIHRKLDGTVVYPDCPETIKSKEDLQRWFEYTEQIYSDNINDKEGLLKRLPASFIKEQTDKVITIMFPRCKHSALAMFTDNECYKIAL